MGLRSNHACSGLLPNNASTLLDGLSPSRDKHPQFRHKTPRVQQESPCKVIEQKNLFKAIDWSQRACLQSAELSSRHLSYAPLASQMASVAHTICKLARTSRTAVMQSDKDSLVATCLYGSFLAAPDFYVAPGDGLRGEKMLAGNHRAIQGPCSTSLKGGRSELLCRRPRRPFATVAQRCGSREKESPTEAGV